MNRLRIRYTMHFCQVVIALAGLAAAPRLAVAEVGLGERIYQKQCASCHGASGEGAKAFPKPLIGNRSVAQLSSQIAKTMPEDDPGSLEKNDADAVAAYVFDAFYSPAARERNKPPRVELARLTVGQYRSAITDLVGSFRAPAQGDARRGLRGEYFNSRGFQFNKRVGDQVDPRVEFDFGASAPMAAKYDDPNQFAIQWEGSLLAPETGEYEFIVRTEHANRLWVNDNTKPLIDALVKSGDETEFRGSLFLLGGRAYPLRLQFSKAKQGVNDTKKMKEKPEIKASIALLWKLPKRTAEVIPSRNLSPNKVPESFVVSCPFPPDDRSLGWERGTTVSKAWDQATTDGALEASAYVASHLNDLAGTKDGNADRDAKIRDFCRKFAERAFRRPLTDEQKLLFVDHQFEAAKEIETAVRRMVLFTLKSPRFLYREVGDNADNFTTASRLSFALWDAPPDQELWKAAAGGMLTSREQIAKQAERMLADPRARVKLLSFLLTWLKVDQAPDLSKDPKQYPDFNAAIATDLRTSLELFLEDVVWSDRSDFRQLLLSDEVHLNGRLAQFYGADLMPEAPFEKVQLNPEERAGVLTHPYLMATFAYTATSSPIHRGVFISRGVLGLSMRPPPEAVTPLTPDLHPRLTTRERVALQTKPAACITCHSVINPLGYTLEKFDAVGRFRDKENDKPVDTTGAYQTREGRTATFAGAKELAKYLADSQEVHAAFVEQLFHHLVKQPIRAYGPNTLNDLRQSFAKNNFHIRKLVIDIALTAALPAPRNPVIPAPK